MRSVPLTCIPQTSYNIFLLEKSARLLKNPEYLRGYNEPTRKLTKRDFLFSFQKTAQTANCSLHNFDCPLTVTLAKEIKIKYGLDLTSQIGEKIWIIADNLAKNNRKRNLLPNQRRV